jgi:hypothetical protein
MKTPSGMLSRTSKRSNQSPISLETQSMEHGSSSPEQTAKTVFWIIVFGAAAFVAGVLILIR